MASQLPVQQAAPRFRVLLLGPFAVYRDGVPLNTGAWQPAVSTLLRLLATSPNWRRSRDEVMDILWPDASPEAAASNLRSKLHLLRRALGGGEPWPVLFKRGWIELNRAYSWEIDLDRFEEFMRTAGEDSEKLEDAVSLYRGEPLAEDRYQDWALPVRERVQRLWRDGMLSLAQALEQRGQYDAALERVELLLDQDPLDEDAVRALIRLLGLTGRRTEAARRYRQFEQRLRHELDLVPEVETVATLEQIKALPDRPAPVRAAAPDRTPPTNLRAALTSFVGREREVKIIQRLLERPEVRLLTLTGTGGTGKTRLALQVGATMLTSFPDGVFFVALESVTDPDLVASAIAAALGVKESPSRSLQQGLEDYLREKNLLLILDNFEHVLKAASTVIELAEQCPRLHVLVTSRAPLHVYGEHLFPVPPLGVPNPVRLPDIEVLSYIESVALFVDRAQAVQPEFALTKESAPAVATICHRLDGLPLAIELAAARAKHFPIEELAARVERRLPFLAGGPRNRPERLQSVRGMVDWSYGLLGQAEQRLFRCLSAFAGGCTLGAATAVCGDDLDLDVLEGLESLVENSLLVAGEHPAPHGEMAARFSMLETLREYGQECLFSSGEQGVTRDRHLAYYLELAERAEQELMSPAQISWVAYLEREIGNLYQALEHALERDDATFALRLASSLWYFWLVRSRRSEGHHWLERALAWMASNGAGGVPDSLRARALQVTAYLANAHSDHSRAKELAEKSLALYREIGDKAGMGRALHVLASVALDEADGQTGFAVAERTHEQALALFREVDDKPGTATELQQLGIVASVQGYLERARALLEEGLAVSREVGDPWRIAHVLGLLSGIHLKQNNFADAQREIEESLELRSRLGDPWGIAAMLNSLAVVAHAHGDLERARDVAEEGLALFQEAGDSRGITVALDTAGQMLFHLGEYEQALERHRTCLSLLKAIGQWQILPYPLEGIGMVAAAQGHSGIGVKLIAAAAVQRDALHIPLPSFQREAYERSLQAMRQALGEDAFAGAWNEGQAMAREEAITCALEV